MVETTQATPELEEVEMNSQAFRFKWQHRPATTVWDDTTHQWERGYEVWHKDSPDADIDLFDGNDSEVRGIFEARVGMLMDTILDCYENHDVKITLEVASNVEQGLMGVWYLHSTTYHDASSGEIYTQ